jgi:hypothetical protein
MVARRRRISATFREPEKRALNEAEWHRIEQQYGRPIPLNLRQQIQNATNLFEWWAAIERCGAPIEDVLQPLKSVRDAAAHLRSLIASPDSPFATEGSIQARSILASCLGQKRSARGTLPTKVGALDLVSKVLTDLVDACNAAQDAAHEYMTDPSYIVRDGLAWVNWVWWLARILDDAGMPVGARNDLGSSSDFVLFFRELQNCRRLTAADTFSLTRPWQRPSTKRGLGFGT